MNQAARCCAIRCTLVFSPKMTMMTMRLFPFWPTGVPPTGPKPKRGTERKLKIYRKIRMVQ